MSSIVSSLRDRLCSGSHTTITSRQSTLEAGWRATLDDREATHDSVGQCRMQVICVYHINARLVSKPTTARLTAGK
jgi:hypothetical protein